MKSGNKDDGWLTGRLYFNREDKRVIIKRPQGGYFCFSWNDILPK